MGAGAVAAATAHIRLVIDRLVLVDRQLKAAHRQLETPCDRLAEAGEIAAGQGAEQYDVTILRSMPGTGRIVIATVLAEAWQPLHLRDYHDLRTLAGVAPVTVRSGKRCRVVRRYASGGWPTRSNTGRGLPASAMLPAARICLACKLNRCNRTILIACIMICGGKRWLRHIGRHSRSRSSCQAPMRGSG
ncbi:transposase [Chelativorans sp. YIM 93263]|uniref:transposase n=1 Tax=Chelativorans sp. YIM 93263 TaxID=2906648 RepID=UPI0023788826|nr:transposase [Chelativorans sp. YIM 93263]